LNKDEFYMKKTIELARKGEGFTGANPLVGALVVKDKKIVGQGYHKFFGGPHAEVYALDQAGKKAKGADLYVNLEPCCHQGKTGPCSLKVVNSGIKRLIVGMVDPNIRVAGKGLQHIEKHGIEVKTGVLESDCRKLNEVFIKYISTDYPFVFLKTAQTIDGFLAASSGDSKWITNRQSRLYGHSLRNKADAILVGIGTVLNDNPSLTTRLEQKKGSDAIRIILDTSLRIPDDAKVINQKSSAKTIIVTGRDTDRSRVEKLEKKDNLEILPVKLNKDGLIPLENLLKKLHEIGIASVLVEGGSRVNYSFLKDNLIDKIFIFTAPRIYGGENGFKIFGGPGPDLMADTRNLKNVEFEKLGDNFLIKGYFS